ncbi:MAG: STAS domain-containing protein [Sedimentisphaerales bacterium]|nr:STAS domain-containing protein [Sedimentisphaerales bacterium]
MTLSVRIIQTRPDAVTVAPTGTIDSDTYRLLKAEIEGILTESVKTIVLDLAEVDLVTSSAIGTIMQIKTEMNEKRGDFAMVNLQPQVKKAFEITNLLPALNVFDGKEELDEYLMKVQKKIIEDQQ